MTKRSDIVGLTKLHNKVKKNAFDLSHRHMFTAEIGELLPVFVQWVNPNETFKIGYNGMTRTTPLQTAAFTRLRENIQYYFVPFQSLWKYFEGNINNMTVGQSGEPIAKIASSPSESRVLGTGMPFINYDWLRIYLGTLINDMANCIHNSGVELDYDEIMNYLRGENWQDIDYRTSVFMQDGSYRYLSSRNTYRYVSVAKLLNYLGYGNFTSVMTYDLVTNYIAYGKSKDYSSTEEVSVGSCLINTPNTFMASSYGIRLFSYNVEEVTNAPNMSVLPLLAYQKVINDNYRYLQWQPYKANQCNIDYILPNGSMNFAGYMGQDTTWSNYKNIFDLGFSNLALDYFNGVLPRAQYGDESAALIQIDARDVAYNLDVGSPMGWSGPSTVYSVGSQLPTGSNAINANGPTNNEPITVGNVNVRIQTKHTHTIIPQPVDVGTGTFDGGTLKISALRSALALQKYKEIQNSNDPDFADQVLAHFGIKPKHDDYKSQFIGGSDATIDINPVVNQNLATESDSTDIKAYATSTLSAGCKFHSDTYGIIIGIYRCTPQLDLAHVGIDRNLFKTDASDFPIPELDSIGMQTQYRCELSAPAIGMSTISSSISPRVPAVDMSKTYGYLPRYAELKTSYDRVDGAFLDAFSSWVTGYTPSMLRLWRMNCLAAGSQTDFQGIEQFLRCNPDITYSIFLNQRSGSVNDDKLLIGSVNTCVAVRPFSKYGLPYEN